MKIISDKLIYLKYNINHLRMKIIKIFLQSIYKIFEGTKRNKSESFSLQECRRVIPLVMRRLKSILNLKLFGTQIRSRELL